jgi:hypothetical protein
MLMLHGNTLLISIANPSLVWLSGHQVHISSPYEIATSLDMRIDPRMKTARSKINCDVRQDVVFVDPTFSIARSHLPRQPMYQHPRIASIA